MNKPWTMQLLHYLLIFVNVSEWKYSCLFMLVHSALMLTNTTCDFNNAFVNAEININ